MDIVVDELKYLFFVGSGRTGSTLLGQILNNHPSCLIANEQRFLQSVVDVKNNNFNNFNLELKNLAEKAYSNYMNGLGKNFQYQKDWKDHSIKIKKNKIKFIGDKKQGGNAQVYRSNTELFKKLIEKIGEEKVYFIQIVRNPDASISSYQNSHNFDYETAKQKVLEDTKTGYDIIKKFKNGKIVYYEDLILDPDKFLSNLVDYLEIECNKQWYDSSIKVINSNKDIMLSSNLKTSMELFEKYEKKNE